MSLLLPALLYTCSCLALQHDREPEINIPAELDCQDRPEWDTFRRAAIRFAERGWPLDTEEVPNGDPSAAAEFTDMQWTVKKLFDRWRWVICVNDCRSSDDQSWEFVRELSGTCKGSGHFDRYLTTHYFRNRGLNFSERQPTEYCHYGFITAVAILAHFEFLRSVAFAQRLLYLCFVLLGDFYAFDWLESTSWPITGLMLTLNLGITTHRMLTSVLDLPLTYGGEQGGDDLRSHYRWGATSEAGKATIQPRDATSLAPVPQLTIWQFDQHTALAGEAKTMLVKFSESIGINTKFMGNSLALAACLNYDMCATENVTGIISHFLDRYRIDGEKFDSVADSFSRAVAPLTASADVLMCSQPLFWCRFLLRLKKTIFLFAGLPVMWDVQEDDRKGWADDFTSLLVGQKHVVIAMTVFMAMTMHWQFGVRVPAQRILGLHAAAGYTPVRKNSVFVSRAGTSGSFSECMFQLFSESNDWLPFQFVQMEAILFQSRSEKETATEKHQVNIYIRDMPYRVFAQHRAAICLPYDANIFLFNELYSMNMPLFVPRSLWRWVMGLQTLPSMGLKRDWDVVDPSYIHGTGSPHVLPRITPFFTNIHRPLNIQAAIDWTSYSDWALFPHLLYFRGVPDLLVQLLDMDKLLETSALMKVFNERDLVAAVDNWRLIAHRLLYASQVTS